MRNHHDRNRPAPGAAPLLAAVALVAINACAVDDARRMDDMDRMAQTGDAGNMGEAGATLDSDMVEDTAKDSNLTAMEICEATLLCNPSVDLGACVKAVQAEIDLYTTAGCQGETSAWAACTIPNFQQAASTGTCDNLTSSAPCDTETGALAGCLRNAGQVVDFACDDSMGPLPRCTAFRGNTNGPEKTCSALGASQATSCPTSNIVGSCKAGGLQTWSTTHYYEPLGTGVTSETLKTICTDLNGVWTDA
ncbi:MAG: hypothetical protein KC416_05080 [Myxococcales bacterium]|nr:hypothetical protein [Myxococcales bacterium]